MRSSFTAGLYKWPSQRRGLGKNSLALIGAYAAVGNHVHLRPQQVLEVLPEAHQVQKRLSLLYTYHKINIAVGPGFSSADGGAHAHNIDAVLGSKTQYFAPLLLQNLSGDHDTAPSRIYAVDYIRWHSTACGRALDAVTRLFR